MFHLYPIYDGFSMGDLGGKHVCGGFALLN